MAMNSNLSKIPGLHLVNWRGILSILTMHDTFKKAPFWACLSISIIFAVCSGVFTQNTFIFLQALSEITINVFPNLLGFSLGGYAIVVGFSNTELIKRSSKTDKHSIYQIVSAIFALIILCQVFTLLICFVVTWCIKIDLTKLCGYYVLTAATIINAIFLFLLTFGVLYSLIMGYFIVINLFTLSQLNNQFYTLEKVKEDNNKKPPTAPQQSLPSGGN